MLYDLILKINAFTENIFYKKIYLSLAFLLFIISFMLQFFHDKYCDLFTEVVRIIHHFSIFFIYCGAFAPSNYLIFVLLFSIVAFLSWTTQNNTCFLTTIEQVRCHYKKNYRFHDIFYYLDALKLPFKVDKLNMKYRIFLLSILNIITLLRLYVYFINKNKLEIHGHRGARSIYPENSILGFDYAMSIGVDVLEMDLNMTKDKNIVIYHDRKINTELCNGLSLPIKELTLSEIKEYDCGIVQNKEFKEQHTSNEKIPTFIELLEFINNSNYSNKNTIKLNIEIKTTSDLDTDYEVIEFANKLISILHKYKIQDRIIIQSFDERALKAVKSIDPSIKLSLLIEDPKIDMIKLAKKLNVDIISPEYILINKELVKQIHDNGFSVLPWTLNSTDVLQKIIDMNVDGVISDNPKEMIDYIKNNK
jgi:glycerophosphoryl diester phosphodiesterase